MYILFFGGFILFLDLINFVMDLNKKRKKGFLHNNFLARYFHACDEKNSFIRINHYLCIVGILLSILAQIVTLFNLSNKLAFLEYIVDNYKLLLDYSKSTQKKSKNKIIHAVKKSIIDTLLDGVLFSALLAWIFSFQIAVIALLSIFIISLTINMIKIRTSKSRFRFLNFDRDLEIPDDIEYFINNIEKYCI